MSVTDPKVQQMRSDCDGWKRMLESLVFENVNLKMQLANMLKANKAVKGSVEAAEQFQNQFMLTDDVVSLARRDVFAQGILLNKIMGGNGLVNKELVRTHNRLRKELMKIEKAFGQLKGRFLLFLEKQEVGGRK